MTEVQGLEQEMETITVTPIKALISLDVLDRIDVRVGTIERVEDVRGSDKLVKLSVNFGAITRGQSWSE